MAISITVNGQVRSLDVDPDTPLLWAIRETLGLTGTKFGCGIARAAPAPCTSTARPSVRARCPVSSVEGASVTTIEGLAAGGELNAVQQAWLDQQVPQCGYCQSGMIMAVSALLAEKPHATDAEIDETITNICRCGTFARVRQAIHGLASDQGGA